MLDVQQPHPIHIGDKTRQGKTKTVSCSRQERKGLLLLGSAYLTVVPTACAAAGAGAHLAQKEDVGE